MKSPRHLVDPDGQRLPIKLDSTSNGEFVPVPLSPANRLANQLAQEAASRNAKRLALGRRDFLVSACGAASTLLAFNAANAAAGRMGGFFDLRAEAAVEAEAAAATLETGEFIFDVQGHYVDPTQAWLKVAPETAFQWAPKAGCALADGKTPRSHLACLTSEEFVKDVFLDSDTDMMVLSFVPARRDASPLEIESADAVRQIVDRMEGNHRLLVHGRVNPNQAGDVENMEMLRDRWKVAAWKTYTQWGPDGSGFFLDDEVGLRFIEEARRLGVKLICVHKGLPFGQKSYEHSQCRDIGPVAKRFPDVSFLIYHSGFVADVEEKAYGQNAGGDGIDTLIRSLQENGIGPGSNVYAELGSTWRFLMRDPEQAAHGLGKLLKYCGPDNVLWGTDSIWYGSPQDQIQAFRAFQIAPEFRERYGYPEITPELRAKIFGLNAMKPYGISAEEVKLRARRDSVASERLAYRERPEPHFLTRGPRTRREFLNLLDWSGGSRA
ncbi:MAG TPA: amidohydrolase family protein [Steroidobacteraceae bacterium]